MAVAAGSVEPAPLIGLVTALPPPAKFKSLVKMMQWQEAKLAGQAQTRLQNATDGCHGVNWCKAQSRPLCGLCPLSHVVVNMDNLTVHEGTAATNL